jgi:NADH-quinone oxidoreductase subunit G
LTEAANTVGGYLVGALPAGTGANAQAMLKEPRRAYILLNTEPELDMADPLLAREALSKAEFVVSLSSFKSAVADQAGVALPVAPFTETAGTFVNCEGRAQAFTGVAQPLGETRPAWKVLRVFGSMLGLPGFAYESIDAVRKDLPLAADNTARLTNRTTVVIGAPQPASGEFERVADVPIYFADPLVRRAPALQRSRDAKPPTARVNQFTLTRMGLASEGSARVRTAAGEVVLSVVIDATVPDHCVRVPAAHPTTAALGPMFGSISAELL